MADSYGDVFGMYLVPVSIITVYLVGKYLVHLREHPVSKGTLLVCAGHEKEKRE
ncbi:hypothetical protein NEAUS04_2394 [Nematocida ausubeli]|nr:hypothetical protein NEAUS06_1955 [Nematocida ausubeli]KAI5137160.1 hypothetical protein NEAUS07_1853 [Nematocida ausubeli]KAI5138023.1 hypothetical protein NEAUS06_2395 [Nematocida ausubeli]KAI5138665.1 hypothetical protein NEAUS07_2427 [Nematocida ausubeli]KAI5149748.1 hypothetical protein NEAUS05_1885 [Nematocida ausubeli]